MRVSRSALDGILKSNVCEVRFVRRIPKPGSSPTRRILCTKSHSLLTSTNGRVTLNYRQPTKPPLINEAAENVVTVWDILMQDYRNISMDQCELIQQIPANEEFWEYFNESIYPMSVEQKINFMNT
jgi:hypothetical protein